MTAPVTPHALTDKTIRDLIRIAHRNGSMVELTAAMRAVLAPAIAPQWQPIETLPIGRRVLCLRNDGILVDYQQHPDDTAVARAMCSHWMERPLPPAPTEKGQP